MQGQFFSPQCFPFPYQLPVNRFPTQPIPQATVFEKAFLIYVMKRNVPFLLIPYHGIQNCDQFAHTSNQSKLFGLPGGKQAQVKRPDHRIEPRSSR
ncbi:hypothetical protein BV924_13655 [Pectobacterium odoriferum]|uniref:Transposase n=1 Tax=Pectobacterium odoriferum TaxID=78398 RepID=A0ABD6VP33_9GAMM|nr:hypothetical protein BVY06_15105 [Pectobacterium odoriferum]POE12190.1 hypothetical protein BV924_13655 [Pectobacterium odoriferum]POE26075.1 hypothetical protein BV926_13660 [Pectobacterium odoriferum]POE30616.1 hypothetical protein BV919_13680 [Pectobacterium odoriferum]POE42683.1 hypothetical protein BV920_03065 [Pectobacterium odoriferum]